MNSHFVSVLHNHIISCDHHAFTISAGNGDRCPGIAAQLVCKQIRAGSTCLYKHPTNTLNIASDPTNTFWPSIREVNQTNDWLISDSMLMLSIIKPTNVFSYESFNEATMITNDFSTSGLAEDWLESECNVFNSFAAWTSESLDRIKWQVVVLLWHT